MKSRIAILAVLTLIAYGCASTASAPSPAPADLMQGIASWYGEEFAGRTTANGEIFDPLLLTAAHRTLPFGTVLDITNPQTNETVRVRVNDRGPYIQNRVIDLSYAAAQKISLIEPGIGQVDIKVVKVGSGEREPPAPLEIVIAEVPASVAPIAEPASSQPAPPPVPVVVDRVVVEEQRGNVITRKQVSDDGRTIEDVPVREVPAPVRTPSPSVSAPPKSVSAPPVAVSKGQFVVQVGAFAVEENARALQQRLTDIGQRAWVDQGPLFRVRIGPFATREQALQARSNLEANGISAIIVAE